MSRSTYLQNRLFAEPSFPVAARFDNIEGLFLEEDDECNLTVTTFESNVDLLEASSSSIGGSESPTTFTHSRSPTLEFTPGPSHDDQGFTRVSKSFPKCSHVVLKNHDEIDSFFAEQHKGLQLLHIGQEHSWAPLRITATAFRRLLQTAAIFYAIQNSIFSIGDRPMEVEVAPPRPQSRVLHGGPAGSNLSGCEISYGLRFIDKNGRSKWKPWSLRQFVVYNKTDITAMMSRWLFVAMPEAIRKPIDQYLDGCGEDVTQNPFDIHCLVLSLVVDMWRPYLVHLTEKVDKHTKNLLTARPDGKGHYALINGKESQALKALEDDLLDAMLAMEATKDTAKRLLGIYRATSTSPGKTKTSQTQDSPDMITHCLNEKQEDIQLLLKQISTLRLKLDSTTKAVANMVNLSMAQQTHQDTQAVKALTVIALVFLPTTVVLNFFSASFIDVTGGEIVLVGKWWLFIVIGLPLTAVILLAWRLWVDFKWLDIKVSLGRAWGRLRQVFSISGGKVAEQDVEKGCMG